VAQKTGIDANARFALLSKKKNREHVTGQPGPTGGKVNFELSFTP